MTAYFEQRGDLGETAYNLTLINLGATNFRKAGGGGGLGTSGFFGPAAVGIASKADERLQREGKRLSCQGSATGAAAAAVSADGEDAGGFWESDRLDENGFGFGGDGDGGGWGDDGSYSSDGEAAAGAGARAWGDAGEEMAADYEGEACDEHKPAQKAAGGAQAVAVQAKQAVVEGASLALARRLPEEDQQTQLPAAVAVVGASAELQSAGGGSAGRTKTTSGGSGSERVKPRGRQRQRTLDGFVVPSSQLG